MGASPGGPRRPRAALMDDQTRADTAERIAELAEARVSDQQIAVKLGISLSQVRGIRRDYKIPAGGPRSKDGRQ